MRLARYALVLVALVAPLAACSDDDDASESDTTEAAESSTDTAGEGDGTTPMSSPILDENGEVDLEALTDLLTETILGSPDAPSEYGWEVTAVVGDNVTIAPTQNADALTEDEAVSVCSTVTSVIYTVLPTAVVHVTDGSGTELAVSGPAGCGAPEE